MTGPQPGGGWSSPPPPLRPPSENLPQDVDFSDLDEDELADLEAQRRHSMPLHAGRPAIVLSQPDDRAGFLAVLRRPDFRLLWIAQAASQLADKFLVFSLLVVVYALSGSSSEQSILMVCYTLPSVLLSAPAGVYADRYDKRSLMLVCNLIRAALVMLIPALQFIPSLRHATWPILILTLLFSGAGQFFAPAEAASIPFLVRRRQIMQATSLFMTTVILTLVLGVPLATLSIKFLSAEAPFYIAAGLFVVSALCVWSMKTSLKAKGTAPESHILRELREGLAIMAREPIMRIGLAQLTLALVVVFTIFVLGPAYMSNALERPPEDTYLVLIPATVGLVGVAAVLGRITKWLTRARLLALAISTAGISLLLLGIMPAVLVRLGAGGLRTLAAVVIAGVFGCALGALLIPAFTILQESTTEETRGRIFGGVFTVINTAVALPLLLAGVLSDRFGVGWVVAGLGVILVALGGGAWTWAGDRLHAVLEGRPQPPKTAA